MKGIKGKKGGSLLSILANPFFYIPAIVVTVAAVGATVYVVTKAKSEKTTASGTMTVAVGDTSQPGDASPSNVDQEERAGHRQAQTTIATPQTGGTSQAQTTIATPQTGGTPQQQPTTATPQTLSLIHI